MVLEPLLVLIFCFCFLKLGQYKKKNNQGRCAIFKKVTRLNMQDTGFKIDKMGENMIYIYLKKEYIYLSTFFSKKPFTSYLDLELRNNLIFVLEIYIVLLHLIYFVSKYIV